VTSASNAGKCAALTLGALEHALFLRPSLHQETRRTQFSPLRNPRPIPAAPARRTLLILVFGKSCQEGKNYKIPLTR
jgi:hypothetical protein